MFVFLPAFLKGVDSICELFDLGESLLDFVATIGTIFVGTDMGEGRKLPISLRLVDQPRRER